MFTLRRLRPAVAWLASFQRLQRKYMRHSLAIFSTSCMALRVQALLFIRHMATLIPDPALDQALKVHPSSSPARQPSSRLLGSAATFISSTSSGQVDHDNFAILTTTC